MTENIEKDLKNLIEHTKLIDRKLNTILDEFEGIKKIMDAQGIKIYWINKHTEAINKKIGTQE